MGHKRAVLRIQSRAVSPKCPDPSGGPFVRFLENNLGESVGR